MESKMQRNSVLLMCITSLSYRRKRGAAVQVPLTTGTVKYYAQIRLQVWQNEVCTGQGNLP